jgi:hypothetical protein
VDDSVVESDEARVQAGVDQGYQDHIDSMKRRVPKTGSKLDDSDAYVLEAHRDDAGNITVLLLTPGTVQPFATGLYVGNGQWNWGHYFDNVNDALYDYMERT